MIGPLCYIGGKNRLASKIISLLPEHTTYVEPFAGGAQVLFHKEPSHVEVLNDRDREIVVQCRSGGRSQRIAEFLQQSGYPNVKNLAGGILAWADQIDPKVPKY